MKNRFPKWPTWRPSWTFDLIDFCYMYFLSTSHSDAFYQVSSHLAKSKKKFQDSGHGGHLGFPIRMILAIFDLHVTVMLSTKFQLNWPFGSEEEEKNRLSRWWPWRPSWINN